MRDAVTGWRRLLSVLLFLIYLGALSYLLFFSEAYGRTINRTEYQYNLHLFREIKRFYQYREILGMRVVMLNLLGNVVAFVPFGIFLPMLCVRFQKFARLLFATFAFSLFIEVLQLVYRVGTFDVDDLFLNTLGGCLGYILLRIYQWGRSRKER